MIADTKFRESLHECVLKRREPRHHGYDGIAQKLRKFTGSSQRPGEEMGGLDNILNYRTAFGTVALKQLLIAMTVQDKVEFPD